MGVVCGALRLPTAVDILEEGFSRRWEQWLLDRPRPLCHPGRRLHVSELNEIVDSSVGPRPQPSNLSSAGGAEKADIALCWSSGSWW